MKSAVGVTFVFSTEISTSKCVVLYHFDWKQFEYNLYYG